MKFFFFAGLFCSAIVALVTFVNRHLYTTYKFPELGQSTEIAPNIRIAEDGLCRLRATDRDVLDNSSKRMVYFPHFHFEIIDKESGLVTENHIINFPQQQWAPPTAIRCWFARLNNSTETTTTIHYLGLPPRFTRGRDRRKKLPNAHLVVLEEHTDGFWITRFDERRQYAGDTWHANRESVTLQMTAEFGTGWFWEEIPGEVKDAVKYAFFSQHQRSPQQTYLRASSEPNSTPEHLLRPASAKNKNVPDELLRAYASDEHTSATQSNQKHS